MSKIAAAGGEAPTELHPEEKFCLEREEPLPTSLCWTLLKNYYEKMALEAWSCNAVPMFVTSNSRIARSYARILFNFLKDWYQQDTVDKSIPVYILEIGAGHGRFTYLVLRHLLQYKEFWKECGLPERPFIFVFSDVAEANVFHAERHGALRTFVDDGWLDFAVFDANVKKISIHLRHSGEDIPPNVPVVVLANYVLDSLVQDAFQIVDGEPRRALMSIYSTQKEDNLADAEIISRMSVSWSWQFMNFEEGRKNVPDYLNENSHIMTVLEHYMKYRETMSFVLPIGAFALFQQLYEFSCGKLMVIVGDKGYPDEEEFVGQKDPHIAIHGSISFMVNIHAIKVIFEAMGGFYCSSPYRDTFQVTALYACGPRQGFGNSVSSFSDDSEDLAPDGLIAWQRLCQESSASGKTPTMKQLLHLLRYSAHDPDVFYNFRQEFSQQCVAPFLGPRAEADLVKDLSLVYQNWFKIRNDEDIPDALAHLCMKTGRLDKALYFFEQSLKWCPETIHASTYVNMASCLKSFGRTTEAKEALGKALEMIPNYSHAVELLQQLEMCEKPQRLAFLGCGRWTCFESLILFHRDLRVKVVGLFSFESTEAENVKKKFNLNDAHIYAGSEGLQQLIDSEEIDAVIVDVHPRLLGSLLARLWTAGKHTLTRSPLAFDVAAGFALVNKYSDINAMREKNATDASKANRKVAWSVLSVSREEDAFRTAAASLRSLGSPLSFSILSVNDSARLLKDGLIKDILVEDLVRGVSAVRILLGMSVDCLSALFLNECEPAKGIARGVGPSWGEGKNRTVVEALRLSGWCRLTGGGEKVRGVTYTPVVGTFYVTRQGGDSLLEYRVICSGGGVSLKHTGSSWKMTITQRPSGESVESAMPSVGNQNGHDRFLLQIHNLAGPHRDSEDPSPSESTADDDEESTGERNFRQEQLKRKVHVTVQDALVDTSIVSGVYQSASKNGVAVSFNYAKKET